MGLEGQHVAVVGAGIGGVAPTLLAARAGARVTLFEREAEPRAPAAGILLQPNGLAVLYGLDLDERLPHRGARLSSLRVADARGKTIAEATVPRFAGGLDHALAPGVATTSHRLATALRSERPLETDLAQAAFSPPVPAGR